MNHKDNWIWKKKVVGLHKKEKLNQCLRIEIVRKQLKNNNDQSKKLFESGKV